MKFLHQVLNCFFVLHRCMYVALYTLGIWSVCGETSPSGFKQMTSCYTSGDVLTTWYHPLHWAVTCTMDDINALYLCAWISLSSTLMMMSWPDSSWKRWRKSSPRRQAAAGKRCSCVVVSIDDGSVTLMSTTFGLAPGARKVAAWLFDGPLALAGLLETGGIHALSLPDSPILICQVLCTTVLGSHPTWSSAFCLWPSHTEVCSSISLAAIVSHSIGSSESRDFTKSWKTFQKGPT